MADIETHPHDVLIIGAGGAGLRAAVAASAEELARESEVYAAERLAEGTHTGATSSGSGTGTPAGIRSDAVAAPNLPRTIAVQLTWKY